MKVENENYRFNHGKAPRGHGAWCFDIFRDGAYTTIQTPPMAYTQACRLALREAKSLGADAVQVAP